MMNRRDALRNMMAVATLAIPGASGCGRRTERHPPAEGLTMAPNDDTASRSPTPAGGARMPVVFVGHGSPMNLIQDNRWSRGFAALASEVPRPRAVLAISAHWYVAGTYLTGNARPRTILDGGPG